MEKLVFTIEDKVKEMSSALERIEVCDVLGSQRSWKAFNVPLRKRKITFFIKHLSLGSVIYLVTCNRICKHSLLRCFLIFHVWRIFFPNFVFLLIGKRKWLKYHTNLEFICVQKLRFNPS